MGKTALVGPRVPELPDSLIELGLVATATWTQDVVHTNLLPNSEEIRNLGDHSMLAPLLQEPRRLIGSIKNDNESKLTFSLETST